MNQIHQSQQPAQESKQNIAAGAVPGQVLVLGSYRQTLAVIRSLGRQGYRIILGKTFGEPASFLQFSRFLSAVWEHPRLDADHRDHSNFFIALQHLVNDRINRFGGPFFVFPVGELQIRVFSENQGLHKKNLNTVMVDEKLFRLCTDKLQMMEMARHLGVPVATYEISSNTIPLDSLDSKIKKVGLPCVLKLNDSTTLLPGNKKAILINGPLSDENLKLKLDTRAIIQKYIQGPRINCQFVARNGIVQAFFVQKVQRTDTFNGTGYGVEAVSLPVDSDLFSYCSRIVLELKYHGPGCIQFLKSMADGRYYFLELNARLDAICSHAVACGVDLPFLVLQNHQLSAKANHSRLSYRVGVKFHWLYGDLNGMAHSLLERELSVRALLIWIYQMISAMVFARKHMTWDVSDPLPSLFLYGWSTPKSFIKWLFKFFSKGRCEKGN